MRTRVIKAVAVLAAVASGALVVLDRQVESRFRGRLFHVPAAVYSRSFALAPGLDVERAGLLDHLRRLDYRKVTGPRVEVGEYATRSREIRIGRRPFHHPDGVDPGGLVVVRLDRSGAISSLRDAHDHRIGAAALEPERLGSFYPRRWEERRLVRLLDVPPHLIDALLAIEDQRFYEHAGLDPRRIGGALLANARQRRVAQGGSTLTQQLVKNLFLSSDRSLFRKFREATMALLLELHHGKNEILEAYLNEIYLGQRGPVAIHGVGAAARHYFARDVHELDLAESALLVGLIRGPGLYSPHREPGPALARRNAVLEILRARERISQETYDRASSTPLGVRAPRGREHPAPYFLASLRQELARTYGAPALEREGYSVLTTLDPQRQRYARRAVAAGLERLERRFPELEREGSPLQAALVALDPASGEILAMVGGRHFGESQFNRALQAHRQPGSAFKPVVALAALGRNGQDAAAFTLASLLEDEPLVVPGPDGEWVPANYAGEFEGRVTLREAIERSLNVPIARVGLALGSERIIETARRLGIESPMDPVPSLALGASVVTLLELTRAYAVIAAEGRRPQIRSVRAVLDEGGAVIARFDPESVRAFEPAETYLVTSALRGAVERGTAKGLHRLGLRGPVAGKTGTTNEYRDAWFVGYTPELVAGVWVGFDDNHSIGVEGAVAALPIFADFLLASLGPEGGRDFQRPDGLERVRVSAELEMRAGWGCSGEPELFLVGTAPAESCGSRALFPWDLEPFQWLSDLLRRHAGVEIELRSGGGRDGRR